VAPVLERSGNKCWIHWRLACPTFLRQTFVEWAGSTVPRSFWAGAYYQRQRAKGCSHQAALRALAYKWIRIVYRCWQVRTPYDESVYLRVRRDTTCSNLRRISGFAASTPAPLVLIPIALACRAQEFVRSTKTPR
jgi:hypothetical protein